MNNIKRAVILCAGEGTRLFPLTKSVCKPMLPLANKPALNYTLEEVEECGIHEVLIIVGSNKKVIVNYLKNKNPNNKMFENLNISFKTQRKKNGTAGALRLAKKFVKDEPFLLLFSDDISHNKPYASSQLIKHFKKCKKNIMAVNEVPLENASNYGLVYGKQISNSIINVDNIVEKPKSPQSNLANFGRYILLPEIFEHFNEIVIHKNKEYYLTDLFNILASNNKLLACKLKGKTFDIGNFKNYIQSFIHFGKEFLKNNY